MPLAGDMTHVGNGRILRFLETSHNAQLKLQGTRKGNITRNNKNRKKNTKAFLTFRAVNVWGHIVVVLSEHLQIFSAARAENKYAKQIEKVIKFTARQCVFMPRLTQLAVDSF